MQRSIKNTWARPKIQPSGTAQNRNSDDIALWNELVDAVRTLAKMNDWSKAEVARRIGMPDGTFSQWYAGVMRGNWASRMRRFNNGLRF
nr:hypothetical protein [Bartonella vinsonii]